jgi:hypothetical protein
MGDISSDASCGCDSNACFTGSLPVAAGIFLDGASDVALMELLADEKVRKTAFFSGRG